MGSWCIPKGFDVKVSIEWVKGLVPNRRQAITEQMLNNMSEAIVA